MPFGICFANGVLQKRFTRIPTYEVEGVHNIHDDIKVAAEDKKQQEYVNKFMEHATQQGVKFNLQKMQFKVDRVKYVGTYVMAQGFIPDPEKIEAIVNMPKPEDKPGLQ